MASHSYSATALFIHDRLSQNLESRPDILLPSISIFRFSKLSKDSGTGPVNKLWLMVTSSESRLAAMKSFGMVPV